MAWFFIYPWHSILHFSHFYSIAFNKIVIIVREMVFIWCAIYYSLPGNIHWRINLMPLYDGRKGRNAMKSCSIIGFVRWFLSRPLDNHFNDTQHYKTNSLELRAWDYLQKCKYMLWFNRISRRQSPLSREGDAERESACCANKLNTLPEYRRKSNTNTHTHKPFTCFSNRCFPFFYIFSLYNIDMVAGLCYSFSHRIPCTAEVIYFLSWVFPIFITLGKRPCCGKTTTKR